MFCHHPEYLAYAGGVMLIWRLDLNSAALWNECVKKWSLRAMATKSPDLHPSIRRRVGDAAETGLLVGTLAAIWISVGWVLVAAILG